MRKAKETPAAVEARPAPPDPTPLAARAEEIKAQVLSLAVKVRQRFGKKLHAKRGQRLGDDLVSIVDALELLATQQRRLKRREKAAAKVQLALAGMDTEKLKAVRQLFKKSRKILTEVAKR